ncbi:putative membrane protein YfhO [Clostridiales Family XIII bacterium PM5-7]
MTDKQLITLEHLALTGLTLLLLFLPMPEGALFGSEGDWYSQHVGAAESIRQMMLETGSILPQHSGLGGGSNMYDFAYYGLLRPDVLFAYFFPNIEMKTIIQVYAIMGVVASVNLCFYWLRRQKISHEYSLIGAVLFAASSCFFHAHHQIIFVNFFPFLLLALLGIDRLIEQRKSGLMVISLVGIYLHSFYYAFPCLVVSLFYFLFQSKGKRTVSLWVKAWVNVGVSIGIAAVLLVPTAMTILSTTKDAGSFLDEPIGWIDLTASGLLYSPYSCGLTLLSLYCLLLSLTDRRKRPLAGGIVICLLIPALWLVLNGGLYPRAKILIPFIPLIIMIVANTLEELYQKRQKHRPVLLLLCLAPALFSQWEPLILIDGVAITMWALVQTFGKNWRGFKQCTLIFLCIIPISVSLMVNGNEEYLQKSDDRQEHFSFGDITMFASEPNYRFDVLANNYVNSNNLPDGKINKTSMYSSISNSEYSAYYYDIMKNPISLRNRVVLMPNQNPMFHYVMGIRYLLVKEGNLPYGYEKVFQRGNYILAENQRVLPICYGTSQLLAENEYDQLAYPDNLEALATRAVVPGKTTAPFVSHMKKQLQSTEEHVVQLESGKSSNVQLDESFNHKILLINFQVNSKNGKQVDISINGVLNKLAAKNAPYPNEHHDFTYVIASAEELTELEIFQSKGEYTISHLQVHTLDTSNLDHKNIAAAEQQETETHQRAVFEGSIDMVEDGYFITSYPYKQGYQAWVDGQKVSIEKVNTAFVGFPLEKGNHKIKLEFTAPGYDLGLRTSICAIIALIGMMIWERKKKR